MLSLAGRRLYTDRPASAHQSWNAAMRTSNTTAASGSCVGASFDVLAGGSRGACIVARLGG
jgi:hypothetical protein